MSNPIKYSTGSESLALKKGNFYIGTGDVGKGPTSTTGYYNGVTPPSGGYTIYLNKESGGPSIYTASNDAQLISLTNTIAGASYTSATQCLVYYAGQTDKICTNREYEGIITDGLVMNVDAGFTPSYPTSGLTLNNISTVGSSNNLTLENGAAYSSSSGGIITLDGTNDYLSGSPSINASLCVDQITVSFWVNIINTFSGFLVFVNKQGSGSFSSDFLFALQNQSGNYRFRFWYDLSFGGATYTSGNYTLQTNTWVHLTARLQQSNPGATIFVNGSEFWNNNQSLTAPRWFNTTTEGWEFGTWLINGFYKNMSISSIQYYNRALSATEVLQNYNATKGRFGL